MLLKYRCSNKKAVGIVFCIVGVGLTKLNHILPQTALLEILSFGGVCIALSGIALFTFGLTSRTTEKVTICPSCLFINRSLDKLCKKCRTPLDVSAN
jgi:collagenase-like PrtC family protease